MSGSLGLVGAWLRFEHLGARQPKELEPGVRNAGPAPLAHRGRTNVAETGNREGAPESVDDLVGVHTAMLGIPTAVAIGIPTVRRIRLT